MSDFAIRKSDGSVWEPSCPDDYTEADAITAYVTGDTGWYFRGGRFVQRGWWLFKKWVWERSGSIWEPRSGEFRVIRREEALSAQERDS